MTCIPDSPAPLPTARQIGDRVLRCQKVDNTIVRLPDGREVATAFMLLARLTVPLDDKQAAMDRALATETFTTRSAEGVMVRKLYYLMMALSDHAESDPDFRPANRDDYTQDMHAIREVEREIRELGWNIW